MRKLLQSAAIAALTVTGAHAETLRWGEHFPECCSMYAKAAAWYAETLATRSETGLNINISYGGSLAKVGEIPTAVENNVINIGNIVTPYFPDQFLINNAIPFFWPQPRTQEELGRLMLEWHDTIPAFSDELAKYNLRLIAVRPTPRYGLICTEPLRSLEDFHGKRVRSYGVALPALLEALGAVPVKVTDVEAYEAMSNNLLDCSPADISFASALRLDDVAKYFIEVPLGASWGHLIVMNGDVYDALPEGDKALVAALREEHTATLLSYFRDEEQRVLSKWRTEDTVEVIQFPEEDFLKTILASENVQNVRKAWANRAIAGGLSQAEVDRIVTALSFDPQ